MYWSETTFDRFSFLWNLHIYLLIFYIHFYLYPPPPLLLLYPLLPMSIFTSISSFTSSISAFTSIHYIFYIHDLPFPHLYLPLLNFHTTFTSSIPLLPLLYPLLPLLYPLLSLLYPLESLLYTPLPLLYNLFSSSISSCTSSKYCLIKYYPHPSLPASPLFFSSTYFTFHPAVIINLSSFSLSPPLSALYPYLTPYTEMFSWQV